jgi:2-polyprenyl-3-methyl-5-hydroxy-6-metoxy-1,4-benzoquinol methylase
MLGIPGDFHERMCTHCGLLHVYPQLSQKEIARYYPSTKYYSYSDQTRLTFFGSLRSYLISHLHSETIWSRVIGILLRVPAMPRKIVKGRILDVGCGSGDTLSQLRTIGWECYGIDIDKKAVEVAHKRGLANVSLGSYEDIQAYPDNFFDAIRLYHVIEHLEDPQKCLSLCYKKLKKNGEIIMGTPNAHSVARFMFGTFWYNLDCPRHVYVFSPKTLRNISLRAKFKDIEIIFCSAGGIVGSVQYIAEELFHRKIDLINMQWLVTLLYPLEWVIDKIGWGDVFEIRATK